jgi:hypothetical protein
MPIPVNIAQIDRPQVRQIMIYSADAERGAYEGFHRSINRAEWTRNSADVFGMVAMKIAISAEFDTITN